MLRCSWCRKKIKENKPVFGLSAKFADGVDFSKEEGTITQIKLSTRSTSVPMIVTASNSDAKKRGTDAIFASCSESCGNKIKEAISKEMITFAGVKDIAIG
jgi:hypothetical protein